MTNKKTIAANIERKIITGMIISDRYLKSIKLLAPLKFLQTNFTKKIASWCIDYFDKFEKSPGINIQNIFESVEEKLDPSEADLVSTFLISISQEFERAKKFNEEYLLKETEKYFESINLTNLSDRIISFLDKDELLNAKKELSQYKPINSSNINGFNPYTNLAEIKDSFEYCNVPLFKFPGAFGQLMNDQFTRDSLIGILAPEKRGKTWWLIEFAHRAYRAKCNVAFFQVGDLSKRQQSLRFHIRLSGKSNREKYCKKTLKPILDCKKNQNDTCKKKQRACGIPIDRKILNSLKSRNEFLEFYKEHEDHEICTYCSKYPYFEGSIWYELLPTREPLNWKESYRSGKKLFRISGKKNFQLHCTPSNTISASDIDSILDIWENELGFLVDTILIDYADLLSPEPGSNNKELRHQQNETWKKLRSISTKRNCLIITATQANAAAYEEESLTLNNYSECKNKYAHTTCFIALNQTPIEKRKGIMRVNQLVVREDEFDTTKEVKILQCLNIGRPFLSSFF